MTIIHVKPNDVLQIVSATFPEYHGMKVKIQAAERVTLSDLNWSGGTRSQYRGCTLDGRKTGGADTGNMQPPWANQYEGAVVPIPPGMCLVMHSHFCGKDSGLTIYVHPSDMPKYLPSGNADLTKQEKAVLRIIRSFVSSYRREEAERFGIDMSQYAETVECLKQKGFLNGRGALTNEGKTVANSL